MFLSLSFCVQEGLTDLYHEGAESAVQFITIYNKEAIKKKIRGDRGEVTVQLVPTIKGTAV